MRGVPGVDFGVREVRGEFPEELEVEPLDGPVDAMVRVPGSKSVTNRVLILAALADGASAIGNALFSDDSYWLMDALVRLGFPVEVDQGAGTARVGGLAGRIPEGGVEVSVGNAGTAARFLPPLLALGRGPYTVDGVPRMRERPVADLVEGLRQLGARVDYSGEEGRFPLRLYGGGLRGGRARVEGSRSSQFLSGLLLAAPYADRRVELEVTGDLVSRPYVGITTEAMRDFGVEVDHRAGRFVVEPATYRAREYAVEPDASAASYFLAAAAVTGGKVRVPGLGRGSSQGDLRFVEVLEQMGCGVEVGPGSVEVRGPRKLRGIEVDMNEISDTMITLSAIAPFADAPTTITNVEHTRHQETDRISAVCTELRRLGVPVEEHTTGLRIIPGTPVGARIHTYGDHRIAMAFSLVGLLVPGVRIEDPACVTKTFPGFFERLDSLR